MIQSQTYRSSTSRPCMHARPDVGIEPGVTIFVLKNHVKNNFGERLGHGTNHDSTRAGVNRAFSARKCFIFLFLGRCPRLQVEIAPSAKNSSRKVARGRGFDPLFGIWLLEFGAYGSAMLPWQCPWTKIIQQN